MSPSVKHENFPNLYTHDHPLLEHKVRILRDRDTTCQTFRRVLGEIAGLMTYESHEKLVNRLIEEVTTPPPDALEDALQILANCDELEKVRPPWTVVCRMFRAPVDGVK